MNEIDWTRVLSDAPPLLVLVVWLVREQWKLRESVDKMRDVLADIRSRLP